MLADHDLRNLVQQGCPATHVARRQRRVQHGVSVILYLQAPGVLDGIHLGVQDGTLFLNPSVMPSPHDLASNHEDGTDRNASFLLTSLSLINGRPHKLVHGKHLMYEVDLRNWMNAARL